MTLRDRPTGVKFACFDASRGCGSCQWQCLFDSLQELILLDICISVRICSHLILDANTLVVLAHTLYIFCVQRMMYTIY